MTLLACKRCCKSLLGLVLLLNIWILGGCGGTGGSTIIAPSASISTSAVRGVAPFTVEFSADNSYDSDGSLVAYQWQFGDGENASQATVSHTYISAGTYSAVLTVKDNDGASASTGVSIEVLDPSATFSIGGTVSAMPYMDVDGDINDPQAPFFDNNGDTLSNIQALVNPVLLNGYLAFSASGVAGDAFADVADPTDVYVVNLEQGQYVSLQTADANADIDLFLLAQDTFDVLASSTNTTAIESLMVPSSGTFYVMAKITAGRSRYFLKVGQESLLVGDAAVGQSGDFEPFESVVKFKPETAVAGYVASETAPGVVTKGQLTVSNAGRKRECLASLNPLNPQTATQLNMQADTGLEQMIAQVNPNAWAKLQTIKAVKNLRGSDDVESAELNYRVRPMMTPNDTLYGYQWNLPQLNLPQAWDITTGSSDVLIAVVDSGIYPSHPELAGQTVAGYDFISSSSSANDGDGIDADPTDPGDDADLSQASWHGTHVTGALVAKINNRFGMAGLTPDAKVMPLRVLGIDGGSVYDVLQAVRYAVGLDNDSGTLPATTADIINLSLGGDGYSQSAQNLFRDVRNMGIFVVAAAGNENSTALMYPASYDGVISVAAYDYNEDRAYYSNYNSAVDVAAPGGDLSYDLNRDGYGDGILSLTVSGSSADALTANYAFYQGTSIATPQVTGIVALMKAVYPDLTPEQFDSLLMNGEISVDFGEPGFDVAFGYGGIDALLAVQAASELASGAQTVALISSPASLVFDSATSALNLNLSLLGDGTLSVVSTQVSETWVNLAPVTVDTGGLGEYAVTVDREGLTEGTYVAQITFATSAGSNLVVGLNMRVGDLVETGDAGRVHIKLLSADTNAVVAETASNGSNGEYPFQFNDVPVGAYYLLAGSDVDRDGVICNTGEICGYFPSYNQKSVIDLTSDKTEMNFLTGIFISSFTSSEVSASSN